MTANGVQEDWKDRFWAKVVKTEGCWLWHGTMLPDGYGVMRVGDKQIRAHRLAWIIEHGAIADGLCVCHHCDIPLCVRPSHLFLGTHKDNLADMVRKGRSTWGERHRLCKLPSSAVEQLRSRGSEGVSFAQLGQEFGISDVYARLIMLGKFRKRG